MQVNPAANIITRTIGNEKTRITVIDDVLREITEARKLATQTSSFGADQLTAYPGVRSPLPSAFTRLIIKLIAPHFRQQFNIPEQLQPTPVMAFFSLLTTPVDKLDVLQRMPHFDSVKDTYFSLVLYLNEGNFGGTGFFRHRPTGFEKILDHRYDSFVLAGKSFTKIYGQPAMKYINSSDPHFELIETVDYKPNRLVAYPGNLLHSGLVEQDRDINADPETGRLTANVFIDFR
ncbi:MAG: DUF6445 family protein [Gammaproteobacteria bacterium]